MDSLAVGGSGEIIRGRSGHVGEMRSPGLLGSERSAGFGLAEVERTAPFTRTPKPSARWYAEVIASNALPDAQMIRA